MMKKKTTLLFGSVLLCALLVALCVTASAEASQGAFSLKFVLSAGDDGKSVVMANKGDVITVSFAMQRTDSDEQYTTNGFQNYIHYDLSFFEFVDGSIVCNDTGMAVAKKQDSVTYGEIIQCQNMANTYDSSFVFCTFQLMIIGESGGGMIYNDSVYAFDSAFCSVSVDKQNLQVIIDSGCTHTNKTKIEAMKSTCNQKGWAAYWQCNDCDAVFDESGENTIAGIPYIDDAHSFNGTVGFDVAGHWFECSLCGYKSEYSAHNGGAPNCKDKGVCSTCGAEYGSTDKQTHTGNTSVKNEKMSWFWQDGYTGDVFCSDCGEIIAGGEITSMFDAEMWPWWVWVIAIPLFPVVLIGWLIIWLT